MNNLQHIAEKMDIASWFTMWDIIEWYTIHQRPLKKIFNDLYIVCNEYSKVLTGKGLKYGIR